MTTRRKALKELRHETVREEILDAARRVLLAQGLTHFTLAAVARELKLTKAALYYYFESKDAVVFELMVTDLESHAQTVAAEVEPTRSGADALEALIRASSAHYGRRLDQLRMSYMVPQVGNAPGLRLTPEMLVRIRPYNELLYGTVATRIRADQDAGRASAGIDGRRLAFLAHTSVIGMLTVEGLVESADDSPLIHRRDAMVDDLVTLFRARVAGEP
jgi:AcrR family transcriptional regulator